MYIGSPFLWPIGVFDPEKVKVGGNHRRVMHCRLPVSCFMTVVNTFESVNSFNSVASTSTIGFIANRVAAPFPGLTIHSRLALGSSNDFLAFDLITH